MTKEERALFRHDPAPKRNPRRLLAHASSIPTIDHDILEERAEARREYDRLEAIAVAMIVDLLGGYLAKWSARER